MADLADELLYVIDVAMGSDVPTIALAFGTIAAQHRARAREPQDAFEQWLIEKWLRQVRSGAFQASAEAEYLRAEWERSR